MADNSSIQPSYAYKNLLLISFVVFTLYTAIFPLHDLQTSLYRENGFGYFTLLIKYIGMTIGSLIFGRSLVERIGAKYSICISLIGYLSFLLANFHGAWLTLAPASLLFGVGAGIHWISAPSYIRTLALRYSESMETLEADVFSKFYPLWFSSFKFSQIIGNIISSNIIKLPTRTYSYETFSNETVCGPSLCPNTKLPVQNVDVTSSQLVALILVSLGFASISIITLLFLNRMKTEKTERTRINFASIFSKTLKEKKMLMLIPLAIETGLQCSFVYADFTKAFVTCYKGIDMIGWAMSVFGVLSVLGGLLYSMIGKYTGPFYILAVTSVMHITTLVCLLRWNYIENGSIYIYLLCAGVLGACETAWRSQLPVVVRHIFPSQYNEFLSITIFFQSIGFVIYFTVGPYLCVYVKIWIVIGGMLLGISLFGIVYFKEKNIGAPDAETFTLLQEINKS